MDGLTGLNSLLQRDHAVLQTGDLVLQRGVVGLERGDLAFLFRLQFFDRLNQYG